MEERKEVNEVLETGCLFRYNHDDMRQGHWKAKDLESAVCFSRGLRMPTL